MHSSFPRCRYGRSVGPGILWISIVMFGVALVLPACIAAADWQYGIAQAPSHQSDTTTGTTTTQAEPTRTFNYIPVAVYSGGCDYPMSSSPEGASEQREQTLDKHGPQLPPLYSMSTFSVMGFTRGNWPVVIDYLLEQDALLLVVVAPEGSPPVIYRLDGKKGHWQGKLQIPAGVGDQPRVAQYQVQALDSNLGQIAASHVHIHGIAAGPKAVGSIGIDQVNFGPATIVLAKHQKAPYSFHSLFDFKNTDVTFVRLANYKGEIIAAEVGTKSTGNIDKGLSKNGEWDGSTKVGELPGHYPPELQQWLRDAKGQHILQVRGWYSKKDGGDWVTALSENMVTVE